MTKEIKPCFKNTMNNKVCWEDRTSDWNSRKERRNLNKTERMENALVFLIYRNNDLIKLENLEKKSG